MIKVEIPEGLEGQVEVFRWTNTQTGELKTFFSQKAYVYNGGRYPELFKLSLPDNDSQGYKAGFYELCPSSIKIIPKKKGGTADQLGIDPYNIKLLPLVQPVQSSLPNNQNHSSVDDLINKAEKK